MLHADALPMQVFADDFNSGLIPRFLLVNSLGMMDSMWALILPNAITVYNLLVARSFFRSTLPGGLLEAFQTDGCTDFQFFPSIAVPLSKAIIAVLTILIRRDALERLLQRIDLSAQP